MIDAYTTLHHLGHAHSVEVWRKNELGGGVYGVALGGLFAGESMFTRQSATGRRWRWCIWCNGCASEDFSYSMSDSSTNTRPASGQSRFRRREYLARLRSALACEVAFV